MQKIKKLYAWVATEEDGGEGIIAAKIGDEWLPMVGADRARMESLKPHAVQTQELIGCPVSLVEFSDRKILEVLNDKHQAQ